MGLDIWIVKEKCGKYGHVWVVGDNNDANDEGSGGTYWDVSKYPGKGPLKPANCPSDIQFNPKSGFDPRHNTDPCTEVVRHIVTSARVDQKVRDKAKQDAKENKGRYDAAGSNCRDYANGLCAFAKGASMKEGLEGKNR